MSTPLQIGILEHFTPIFIFVLIFVIFYAVLIKTKLLGDNKGLMSLVAFVIALLFLITQAARDFVQVITPWFVILIIIAMCFLLIFMFLGIKPDAIATAISNEGTVWTIIIILLVLLGLALTKVLGPGIAAITQQEGSSDDGFMGNVAQVIFHPKILGMFFILVIASFAVKAITRSLGG